MLLLIFFVGTFLCASVSGNTEAVFRKCCPKSQSLVKVSGFNMKSEIYECLTREEVENQYNVSNSPLIISNTVSVDYGMPKLCDGLKILQLSREELNTLISTYTSTKNESCYERLVAEVVNGSTQHYTPRVVALTCFRNETEDLAQTNLTIEQMRKCCPKGRSYDTKNHICRVSEFNTTEEWIIGYFNLSNDFIYEVAYGLQCKRTEFGVELSEELFYLDLQSSSLNVLKKNGEGGGVASRGQWCIDREYGKLGLVARVCTQDCSSYRAFCLRKCCPVGQHYRTRRCGSSDIKCVPNDEEIPFNVSVYLDHLNGRVDTDVLGIRTERILHCPKGQGLTSLNLSWEEDYHYLTSQGTLESSVATNDSYCFEALDSRHCPGEDVTLAVHICFALLPIVKNFQISAVVNTISSVCLAMTLIIYFSLPELRNLHGKMLICHASMMLVAFSCLASAQYTEVWSNSMCTALGYGIYFGFTAAFAWLNVMCFDIWTTLRSLRTIQQDPWKRAGYEWRRFLWYSLYAWSVAIVLTVTLFLLDRFTVADWLDANIGDGKCWFGTVKNSKTDWPHYIFFVIPMGLFTCTNFVLFMLTARHCARVKSEIDNRMQADPVGVRAKKRFRIDRAKYVLTVKLWVVMGAGWFAEILSTLFSKPEWLWATVDLINELQGVFIFLILISKPKLLYLIRKRLGLETPDGQRARTSSTFMTIVFSTIRRLRQNRQIEDVGDEKRNAIKQT